MKSVLFFLAIVLFGCSSLPPNHSTGELRDWASEKGFYEKLRFNRPPVEIYAAVVPCLMTRYKHRGFNNRHTYTDRDYNDKSDSAYFAVNKYDDHIYIELLEIKSDNAGGSILTFYGYDKTHFDRLVANALHICNLNVMEAA